MHTRLWAVRSPLAFITKALKTTPLTQGLSALPAPKQKEAQRFLAPHAAPLPRPLPVSTSPITPRGAPPPRHQTAQETAQTPPRKHPHAPGSQEQALHHLGCASRPHPARLGSAPTHLPAVAEDTLRQTPAAPSALRGSVQAAGTPGSSLPWSRAQAQPGTALPKPRPPFPSPDPPAQPLPALGCGRPAPPPYPPQLAPGAHPVSGPLPVGAGSQSTSVTNRFPTRLRAEKARRGGALRGPREAVMFRAEEREAGAGSPQTPGTLKAELPADLASTAPDGSVARGRAQRVGR